MGVITEALSSQGQEMEICSELEYIQQILPDGWRVFQARLGDSYQYFILNPDGKRFETFDEVYDFIVEENMLRKKGLRKKRKEIPTYLTTNSILRRHQNKIKNPFTNLLKKALEKSHVTNDVFGIMVSE